MSGNDKLRQLPAVHEVVERLGEAGRRFPRRLLVEEVRRVLAALDLQSALDELARAGDGVDLVTLDVLLGGEDCSLALKKMMDAAPGAKVLLCTGFAGDEDIDSLMDMGACGIITKPFSLDTLKKKLEVIFE